MEKGTVKMYDKNCGMGVISRAFAADVQFYSQSIVGRGRAHITQGDSVWFEINDIKNLHIAINVLKCN